MLSRRRAGEPLAWLLLLVYGGACSPQRTTGVGGDEAPDAPPPSQGKGSGTGAPALGPPVPVSTPLAMPPPLPAVDAPMVTKRTFTRSEAALPNPERGFFYESEDLLKTPPDLAAAQSAGQTLVRATVRLDAYRAKAVDAALLSSLDAALDRLRRAGLKVVLRFAYNGDLDEDDASRSRVVQHIGQLAPTFAKNVDVLYALEAGFIGAWGEWHSSSHELDEDPDGILEELLDALPKSRMVLVRQPHFKADALDGPLTTQEAFGGSPRARVGHHNDCFLGGDDDDGTYLPGPAEAWKRYIATDGRFVPVGGETCKAAAPRTGCPSALAELERLHWSYLNRLYKESVVAGWTTQGCLPEIDRRLGYRLFLQDAEWSASVPAGGTLTLAFNVGNGGFASLVNPRPVYVVLDDGTRAWGARIADDPRRWEAGTAVTVNVRPRTPRDLPPGRYKLALWLPDDAATLRQRPAYAVRLANEGLWDAARGYNVLTSELTVTAPQADVDGGPADFLPLPR